MVFMFSDYTLDVDRRELRRGSEPVPVEPQVFDLLILLIQNRDRVVSKDDLIASIWGGRTVSESALTSRINAARKAVGDSGEHQRLIRTISRKGIRFVAEVSESADSSAKVVTADRPSLPPSSSASPAENKSLPPLDKPSVAVMLFANLSGDPEWEHFAEGIAEDIITELSRVSALFVIARNSSFTYRGRSLDLRQVGRELGVRYIVEGTVRRGGDRIRITSKLIEAETGKNLWAEKYDRELADMFIVQDEIIAGLVASMQTQMVLNEGLVVERQRRPDLSVWDLAKRGLKEIYELTGESLERALAIGYEILSLDRANSKGHQLVALGAYHLVLMGFTDSPDRLRDEAFRAAREADPIRPEGRVFAMDPWNGSRKSAGSL